MKTLTFDPPCTKYKIELVGMLSLPCLLTLAYQRHCSSVCYITLLGMPLYNKVLVVPLAQTLAKMKLPK